MVVPKREKITLKFNPYEAGQLNALQYSYLLGNSHLAELPTVNQILRGILQFTVFLTKDKRVLRGFSNNFLRKRNLPPTKAEELQEDEWPAQFRPRGGISLPPEQFRFPQPGNFSFYTDSLDIERISGLRSEIAQLTGISPKDISSAEIVRESIHFVFNDESRNLFFRYVTYIGFLYGITPITSVIVSFLWRKTSFISEVVQSALRSSTKEEFRTLLSVEKDASIFKKFQIAFNNHSHLDRPADVNALFGKFISEVSGFDFLLSFIGMEAAYYISIERITEMSDSLLYLIMNSKPSILKIGLDIFRIHHEIFTTVPKLLKDDGLPDADKKILNWIGRGT